MEERNLDLDHAALAGAIVLIATVGVDLASKAIVIATASNGVVVFNRSRPDDLARRIAMSLVAFAVMYGLAVGARRLGIGRLWGGWIGTGLLIGGVLGNGLSWWIWNGGIPDFIRPGGHSHLEHRRLRNRARPVRRHRLDRPLSIDRILPRALPRRRGGGGGARSRSGGGGGQRGQRRISPRNRV